MQSLEEAWLVAEGLARSFYRLLERIIQLAEDIVWVLSVIGTAIGLMIYLLISDSDERLSDICIYTTHNTQHHSNKTAQGISINNFWEKGEALECPNSKP